MELKIDKLVYGGDALARVEDKSTGRAKAIFVPFAIPGEIVNVSLTEQKTGFARAQLREIVKGSEARIEPACTYFYRCGGCHYQHIRYEEQLTAKAAILEETLSRTARLKLDKPVETHASPSWNYRNRTRMRVSHEPEFAIGYYRMGSHVLLPVEKCPISSPLINRTIAAVWSVGRRNGIDASVREVQFFADHDDQSVLLELYTSHNADPERLKATAQALQTVAPEIAGIAFFAGAPADDSEDQRAPMTRSGMSTGPVLGENFLTYKAASFDFRVSAGSFFQTNRFVLDRMCELVTRGRSGKLALDLYAGVGLFTLPLAKTFEQTIAVEISPHSFADLKTNAPRNVKAVRATTEQFLESEARRLTPDLIVVDPPRAGLGARTTQLLGKTSARRITYVSCDPATLSRDIRGLIESGFQVEEAHLVDLFPQTFHLETILQLVR